ncbi:MAG: AsmA family protein [Alphaproteobacteria bacterium]|nr:AsmA family protein [Alphaproteobacteria bacterium]
MMRRWLGIAVIVAIALPVAGAAVFLATFDADRFRPEIEAAVTQAIGRKLTIGRPIRLAIGLKPRLELDGIVLANAAWGTRPEMVKVAEVSAAADLVPLLSGRLRIDRVALRGLDLWLESDAQGRGNWLFSTEARPAGEKPAAPPPIDIGGIVATDVRVTWVGQDRTRRTLVLDRLEASGEGAEAPVDVQLAGTLDGHRLRVLARLDPPAQLMAGDKPYALNLNGQVGPLLLAIQGTIGQPHAARGLDFGLSAEAGEAGELARLVGAAPPGKLGALSVKTRLKDTAQGYVLDGLALKLGASTVTGSVEINPGARHYVGARLKADVFDLAPLQAPTGAKPAPAPARNGRVIPDHALPNQLPDEVELFVDLAIGRVIGAGAEIRDLAAQVTLGGGKVTLRKLEARVHGGQVSANGEYQVGGGAPRLGLRGGTRGLDLGQALKAGGVTELFAGTLDVEFDLRGRGATLRQMAASLDGGFGALVPKGEIANQWLDLIAADLVAKLVSGGKSDRMVLNCAAVQVIAKQGRIDSQLLLLDTPTVTVSGGFAVTLANEALAGRIEPRPKEASLLSLAVPVILSGTLASPGIAVEKTALAKAGAALALSTVIGPLALLGTTAKAGAEDKNPCARIVSVRPGVSPPRPAPAPPPQGQAPQRRRP